MWVQRTIRLQARPRGFHLVTAEVLDALPELAEISVGILRLLIQHTSASLTLSENASPEARHDFEAWFDRAPARAVGIQREASPPLRCGYALRLSR
jgi:thiamine phosphate synthase YjbQ (UPF0047 family)